MRGIESKEEEKSSVNKRALVSWNEVEWSCLQYLRGKKVS